MLINDDKRPLAGVTAAIVTTAAFAKMFLPFYLIGSTAIFAVTSAAGGILIFHALFMIFGFATARALNVLLMMLLGAAAIYLIVIVQYTVRFGDLEQGGYLHDIFGVGQPAVFVAFHQKIGILFALAMLAALGLASNRIRR